MSVIMLFVRIWNIRFPQLKEVCEICPKLPYYYHHHISYWTLTRQVEDEVNLFVDPSIVSNLHIKYTLVGGCM